MAVIKSGASTDELDIDPTSKAARVTLYDTSGNPISFGSGGTSAVDEAAFTAGTTQGTPAMGAYQTSPAALTNGQLGVLSLDSSRRLIVNVGAGSTGNAAASATGASVPASADYGGVNVGGTLRGATAVNPSGTIYAQQVDLASVVGTTMDVNSGSKSAGTQRIVIATDQPQLTNALKVDGSAVTQPVSAASLPLPAGASTSAKQPALGTAGTASADVISVQGIASMTPLLVTPAANSAVNLAQVGGGSTAVGHGTAATALRVELPTDGTGVVGLNAGTNLVGQVSSSDDTATIYAGTTALTPKWATITASSSGANTQVAAVTSKHIRVVALSLMASGTVNVKFQSHVSPTDITGLYYLIANTGFVLPYNPKGWFQTIAGEALDTNLSGSVAVGGVLQYVEVL